ncbi:MAG: hypothetical protein J7K54_03620 [Candidatus Aenigmarchaeota archaeon]|nr:hypothetical protein [Candidatus Aenigmarchaeota archaeon]
MNIGLLFGMVVAIFTIGLLIVFGYQQIGNASDVQKQAQFLQSIKNLQTATDRVYNLGGESSEKLALTFPSSVEKVCFMPMYRDYEISERADRLKADLRTVLGYSSQTTELAEFLLNKRITGVQSNYATDGKQTLLVFFASTSVPEWYYIEHLEPTKKGGDYHGTPLCVLGDAEIWLRRSFDENGAWVDVEEA